MGSAPAEVRAGAHPGDWDQLWSSPIDQVYCAAGNREKSLSPRLLCEPPRRTLAWSRRPPSRKGEPLHRFAL